MSVSLPAALCPDCGGDCAAWLGLFATVLPERLPCGCHAALVARSAGAHELGCPVDREAALAERLPRQTCCWCFRTVGTLPDGRTLGYATVEADPSPLGSRRFHYCEAPACVEAMERYAALRAALVAPPCADGVACRRTHDYAHAGHDQWHLITQPGRIWCRTCQVHLDMEVAR